MSRGKVVARGSRVTLPSIARIGAALAALLAVTIAFGAWSSANATNSSRSAARSSAVAKLTGKECREDRAAGTIYYVTPFGYSASAGIIDVYGAAHLNYFKDLCLTVSINAAAQDPQTLVEADQAQVSSTGGAANVMEYDAAGSGNRLVGVETISTIPSNAVIMNSKYKSLKQMEGQTFGDYGPLPPAEIDMFVKAKVPISSLHLVRLSDYSATVAAQGLVAGYPALAGNEDVMLKQLHVKYTEITAAQLGIKGTTYVMFMNRTFLQKHPVAAENFIRADLLGMDYCVAHQAPCVDYLAKLAASANEQGTFGKAENAPVWRYAVKVFIHAHGTKPLGTFTSKLWDADYSEVKKFGSESNRLAGIDVPETVPGLNSMLDTKLVDSVYNAKGQLIWP